ncbi:MAG: tRNA (N6-isopentenyl adenosine(37)-C2)-methylthiotransferase MiaB [Thermodesulfovibrionales bacterium]|nr:tRNA (N6-isopentenyl adenosine(37)-C2)-methylthiotransferase MiaB [Thermodesulfovibrionales bacterium]
MISQKKYHIITFGCQMNEHDSEKIAGLLEQKGFTQSKIDDSDLVIINTCSIRKKAEDKFYSQVGRFASLKKRNPYLKIGVVGCVAQQEGSNILKRYGHVDFVLGTMQLNRLLKHDPFYIKDAHIEYSNNIEEINFVKRKSSVKALVNIMFGCNNFCSYCVVPYTRGPEKSRGMKNILEEITDLAEKGYKEVMLLGQNVNSYKSGDNDFVDLLKEINNINGIERIRFMTSHPKDLSDRLINSFGELNKLCEHIHLPLQSGSSRILKLMNRCYNYQDYLNLISRLRSKVPDIAITTDIITGFPYETEEDHKDTLKALQEIEFDGIFSFKYSKRPGTKASSFDNQVEEDVKERRLSEINNLQDTITDKKNEYIKGRKVEVLIDDISDKKDFDFIGRTRTNKIVYLKSNNKLKIGDIVSVIIKNPKRHNLEGEI